MFKATYLSAPHILCSAAACISIVSLSRAKPGQHLVAQVSGILRSIRHKWFTAEVTRFTLTAVSSPATVVAAAQETVVWIPNKCDSFDNLPDPLKAGFKIKN